MRRAFLVCLLSCAALGAGQAAAQAVQPTLASSPAVECLARVEGARTEPEYPEDLVKRKDGGRIPVQLVFMAPDQAPVVRILDDNVSAALIGSVQAYAKDFRVPCMAPAAEPVRLTQEYVFTPNDGRKVMSSRPIDAADTRRRAQLACMTRIAGDARPAYPSESRRREQQGNVYVRMRFTSPTEPPAVTVLASPRDNSLWGSVEQFVANYRMPCLGGEPVDIDFLFSFVLDGGSRTRLRDLPLKDWVLSSSDVRRPAYFDTATMGCPFDVRLTYHRPHRWNDVREIEASHPARGPFLDWLAAMTLKLDQRVNNEVLGDTITVAVPCIKIDI